MAQEFSYEIIEEIAVLSENNKGWRKELNLVSWNGRPPKFDLRDWAPDHEKMGKGLTPVSYTHLTLPTKRIV